MERFSAIVDPAAFRGALRIMADDYIFADVAVEPELARLRSIEAVFDPATQLHLLATGVWTGRRCLEVGAGAGSIAAWMRAQTGATGRIVAVDSNARFLEPLRSEVEIVHADVRDLGLAEGSFDVAHVRYVLVHNHGADGIVANLVRALVPGGWLLVEEPDFTVALALAGPPAPSAAFDRVNKAIAAMFRARGLDPAFGRHVPALIHEHRLELVDVEWDAQVTRGSAPLAEMMCLSARQLRDKYVATGHASSEDVDAYRAFASDPACWGVYYCTVRVLARRPAR